jgi:hypothetical protein
MNSQAYPMFQLPETKPIGEVTAAFSDSRIDYTTDYRRLRRIARRRVSTTITNIGFFGPTTRFRTSTEIRRLTEAQLFILRPEYRAMEKHAIAVDRVLENESRNVILIGRELEAAHGLIANHGDGEFGKWIEHRFDKSRRWAEYHLQSFRVFGDCEHVFAFDASALRVLSAPSTPPKAVSEAIALAENGAKVTHKVAKRLVKQFSKKKDDDPKLKHTRQVDALKQAWERGTPEVREEFKQWLEEWEDDDVDPFFDNLSDFEEQD